MKFMVCLLFLLSAMLASAFRRHPLYYTFDAEERARQDAANSTLMCIGYRSPCPNNPELVRRHISLRCCGNKKCRCVNGFLTSCQFKCTDVLGK
ncbi:hypothetical protein V1264_005832 [Littorina saxatilis]|uniref:Uncharacterized protein n=1 Tax=Littorina saxatilis TaxID=31220 RepID=A0AAN9AZS8_9CAEN